ncbi:MAG: acetone carboxylase subunit gamma [Desulfotomaculaceae bacterium]
MERQQIRIGDNLRLERRAGEACFICSCDWILSTGQVNFKEQCRVKESPTSDIGPGYASFDPDMAGRMCFREFFCPNCGVRLATEVARVGDPYLCDIQPKL